MKLKWTLVAAVSLIILSSTVYYTEFVYKKKQQAAEEQKQRFLNLNREEINFFKIEVNGELITLQKTGNQWSLLDPIQDKADEAVLVKTLDRLFEDKTQLVQTKESTDIKEYGLDKPFASITLKSSTGQSQKIFISTEKNFENLYFLKQEGSPQVYLGSDTWLMTAKESVTYFREKKLFRGAVADIDIVSIKALNEKFTLHKVDGKWAVKEHPDYILDQNIVRAVIKDIAELKIEKYIQEGEPSQKELSEKGLKNSLVEVSFSASKFDWDVHLSLDEKDSALYALTSKPSYLLQLPIAKWESVANLTSDHFRDRISLMIFNKNDVQKFYSKINNEITEFENVGQTWKLQSALPAQSDFLPLEAEKILDQVHELKISEFVNSEDAKKFTGQNMIILKSNGDNLVFQLNWGPLIKKNFAGVEKEVYLARTQFSQNIFALDKMAIDQINLASLFQKKEIKDDKN